jgi:hypothetical protein
MGRKLNLLTWKKLTKLDMERYNGKASGFSDL